MMAKELKKLGYLLPSPRSLKTKHVNALLRTWQQRGLSPGTIKNYTAHLRWWAEKVEKYRLLPRNNRELSIPDRDYTALNKAQYLSKKDFERIKDDYLRHSVMLQQAFGLRREESMKFRPVYADQGHFIRLKGSWTKGGRPRRIPITRHEQRELLDSVRRLVGSGSLIPTHKQYKHQLGMYQKTTIQLGFRNLHGLRHGYAQLRYKTLTGWACPLAGGPTRREMTKAQHEVDQSVRLKISQELGHNRIEITKTYLG